ncbi:MAG: hypothetical protein V3T00_05645 [bacterium]
MNPHPAIAAPPVAPPQGAASPLRIDLWCNHVAGGWSPHDLETGLGGSEECLVLWAEALADRGHRVRIYHNPTRNRERDSRHGVAYLPHHRFDPGGRRDVLVSWKSPHPWAVGARAARRIHWSSDVERPWPDRMLAGLDAFVTLTPYHRRAMRWLDGDKARIFPHGVDFAQLGQQKREKVPDRAIYASSPDRGLLTLLRDWPRIRLEHPGISLQVLYGWKQFLACTAGNPQARAFQDDVLRLMGQEGIVERGQVTRAEAARAYWAAEYWLHPLNRAESELFCLNALKARHCGALAVVNRIGALENTVTRWVDYRAFVRGERTVQEAPPCPELDWPTVVERFWEPLWQSL